MCKCEPSCRGAARPPPHHRGVTYKPGPGRLCGCGLPQPLGCAIFTKKRVVFSAIFTKERVVFSAISTKERVVSLALGQAGCAAAVFSESGLPFSESPAGLRHMAPG